ncbi:hypothetical protein CDL12_13625 [Handroanthus impetiginosus]|uniref:Clp R domain-containing protein n=1 Tax=Handroanthus impetiginosus TaxID=429701 RepID=A0A2G9H8A4_9LAMI|nr:hypothetical protein CDL12_13625 [Handroanthus impetiginosus]
MAAQGLSVLPIASSSTATNQSCRKTFEQVLSFNLSNSFVGRKLSIRTSNFIYYVKIKTEGIDPDKQPKWSSRAIRVFALAEMEARKLKYPNTGTETLLLGIMVEGTSLAAKFLRENGITHTKVRDEAVDLLGKGDMFFMSPENPPLTGPAQRAIDWAVEEKLKSGDGGEITVAYLVLGIWATKESAGHIILANLGFDDDKAKELAKNMDKDIILSYK